MNSKLKAFALAAIVASIAVLAVLPAEDVSAETTSVEFTGYKEIPADSGRYYSTFDVNTESEFTVVYLTIGDNDATRGVARSPTTTLNVGVQGQIGPGEYPYSLTLVNGTTEVGTDSGTVEVGSVAEEHTISVGTYENGAVTSDVQKAAEGATVTLTVAPSEHYALTEGSLNVTYGETEVELTAGEAANTYTFSMPASDVTVSAAFEPVKYTITWNVDGTVTTSQFPYNTVPSYDGTPVKDGYDFKGWSLTAGGDVLAEIPAATADATYYAVFEQKEAPVGDHKVTDATDVNGKTVSAPAAADEGVTVTIEVVPDSGYELDVLTVVDASGNAVATVKVDDTHYTFSMPASDVEVSATFKVSETPAPVDTGIAIDGVQYGTVKDALAKAESGDVIVISKAIPAENVTLVDDVSISITKDGSYTGTVTYDGSKVKIVSLGAGSVVAISGGSVDVSGNTFVGESEIQVAEGTMVLAGEIAAGESSARTHVTVDVEAGATLQIDGLTLDAYSILEVKGEGTVVLKDGASSIVFAETSNYRGPAFTADGSADGTLLNVPYPETSRITYDGVMYMVYRFTNGTQVDIRAGFGYYETSYTGSDITLDYLTKVLNLDFPYKVFYASNVDSTSTSDARQNYTIRFISSADELIGSTPAIVEVDWSTVQEIKDPAIYDYAFTREVQAQDESGQGIGSTKYVRYGVIVDPVSAKDLTASTEQSYPYDGDKKTIDISKVVVKDKNGNIIDLGLTDDMVSYPVEAIDVGTYEAVITFPGAGIYGAGVFTVTFEITKAKVTIVLTDKTEGAGWLSEQYVDGNVYYTIDSTPMTDGAKTVTLKVDGTVFDAPRVITSQDDLDDFIAEIKGQQYDNGYILTVSMVTAATDNFEAGESNVLEIPVGKYKATQITVAFEDVDDSAVKTTQDGLNVKIVAADEKGLAKDQDGKYSFTVEVSAAAGSTAITMVRTDDTGVTGRTVMTPVSSYTYDSDTAIAAITFSFDSLPAGSYKLTVYAGDDETRYITSDEYTIDLSGLVSNDIAIYLVEAGYPVAAYYVNQYYDLSAGTTSFTGKPADNQKFYLPGTAAASSWTLQTTQDKKTAYGEGALYIVDVGDRTTYTLPEGMTFNGASVLYGIVFVATAGSSVDPEPEETQTISIYGAGYYEKAADANKAMSDYGASVSDASDKTMFVFYSTTVASDITVTVTIGGQSYVISKYEQTPSDVYADVPVGKHYVYWSFTENTGTSVPATYASGDVATITVADASGASASITVGWSGGQTVPTPTPSTETTYTVFYVVDGAVVDSATQKDLKAGDALVFPTVEGKTITWSGVESTTGLTATADAVYIGTTVSEPVAETYTVTYVIGTEVSTETVTADKVLTFPTKEGQTIVWYLDGTALTTTSDVKVSADTTYVGVVQAETPTYSSDLGVIVSLNGTRLSFVIAGYDGNAVPQGTVTLTYTTLEDVFGDGNFDVIAHTVTTGITMTYTDGSITAYGYVDIPADASVYSYYGTFSSESITGPVNSQVIYREAA